MCDFIALTRCCKLISFFTFNHYKLDIDSDSGIEDAHVYSTMVTSDGQFSQFSAASRFIHHDEITSIKGPIDS